MTYTAKAVLNRNGLPDRDFKAGDIVKHFKGGLFRIIAIATNTETEEFEIIYEALSGEENNISIWARPSKMFISEVDRAKYPGVIQEYRFEKVDIQPV